MYITNIQRFDDFQENNGYKKEVIKYNFGDSCKDKQQGHNRVRLCALKIKKIILRRIGKCIKQLLLHYCCVTLRIRVV